MQISSVEVTGLTQTRSTYLSQFIHSKAGDVYDSTRVKKDVQHLHNLRLFADVRSSVSDSAGYKLVRFHCEELTTLLPIVNFGGVTDNFWYQLGAVEYNWLGRGNTLGAYYRYYDRHSGVIYMKAPYLFGRRWGGSLDVSHFATIEPIDLQGSFVNLNVDHQTFVAAFSYTFSPRMWVGIGGGLLMERYALPDDAAEGSDILPAVLDYDKFLYKLMLAQDYLDYFFQYLNGLSNELHIESVQTDGEPELFWKVLNTTKYFIRMGERGNLGIRSRIGFATNKDSPFVPFVLDNYLTVRGSGNRLSRGTAEITFNIEYRHTISQRPWGGMQGVLFLDQSAWRPGGGTISEMYESQNNVTFTGVGIRLYLRRLNNFIFRIDYGTSLTADQSGFVIGAGQYF